MSAVGARPPDRQTLLRGIQLSVRAGVAASVALALARLFELQHPLYSFVAAVIVTDLSPAQTRRLGWQRLVATVAGATCGAALSQVLPAGSVSIGLGVLLAMLACIVLRIQDGAKVGGYICGIVMHSYGAEPWSYAGYRLVETLLGIGVAWSISLVPKLIRTDPP